MDPTDVDDPEEQIVLTYFPLGTRVVQLDVCVLVPTELDEPAEQIAVVYFPVEGDEHADVSVSLPKVL